MGNFLKEVPHTPQELSKQVLCMIRSVILSYFCYRCSGDPALLFHKIVQTPSRGPLSPLYGGIGRVLPGVSELEQTATKILQNHGLTPLTNDEKSAIIPTVELMRHRQAVRQRTLTPSFPRFESLCRSQKQKRGLSPLLFLIEEQGRRVLCKNAVGYSFPCVNRFLRPSEARIGSNPCAAAK